jgi:hypothetical protein
MRRFIQARLAAAVAVMTLFGLIFVGGAGATPVHWVTTPNPFGTFIPGVPGDVAGLQSGGGIANGASCPRRNFCMAVGGPSSGPSMTLFWNGKQWFQAPNSIIQSTQLTSISCPSVRFCMAVGYTTDGSTGNKTPIAEQWNGVAWKLSRPQLADFTTCGAGCNTADPQQRLNSVSCSSSYQCTAVGSFGGDDGSTNTLAEHWDGSTWTIETTFGPAGTSTFNSVSCPTEIFCFAAGANDAGPRVDGSGEKIDGYYSFSLNGGRSWARGGFPPDPFESVSCTAIKFCMVSGLHGIFEWRGLRGAFSALQPGELPGLGRPGFTADWPTVSCTSSHACVGVARQTGPTPSGLVSLIITWDGHSWSQPSGHPLGGGALVGTACADRNYCVAVGAPTFFNGPGPLLLLGR